MSERAAATQEAKPAIVPATRGAVLQRACACGKHTTDQNGECTECRKKRLGLQRRSVGSGPDVAPPIVHDVLRSPGRPLDEATRGFMESRFNHDFSGVRVHTDGRAAASARAVNALAYTVGNHVAFDSGQYTPGTSGGRGLLAHELAHTVQQGGQSATVGAIPIGRADSPHERAADRAAGEASHAAALAGPAAGAQLQRRLGDGHDLTAQRFARNLTLEAVFDNERTLQNGSSGTAVRLVQESLIAQGYDFSQFGADGIFGGETESRVREFQIDAGATGLDGVIGPETMALLDMRDPGTTRPTGPRATPPRPGAPAAPAATGVVFAEHPRETFAGFDDSVAPSALVVPINERRRTLATITPAVARPAITSDNTAVATVDPTPDGIVVTGVSAGAANITAVEGGVTLDAMQVVVKNQLRRSVAFHYVCDSAVPPHCSNGAPTPEAMRSLLNRVWERQANVMFTGGASQNVVAPGDLGAAVDWTSPGGGEWNVVTALGAGANYNVFRVWHYLQDGGNSNDAANLGVNTLLGDNPCVDGWGLPHEAGHFLGLDHPDGFIMTPCDNGRADQRVSRAMADRVNP